MLENTVIIGVGRGGCNALSKVKLKIEKLFVDTDKNVVEKYSGFCIGLKTCNGLSTGGDVVKGELSLRESKLQILDRIGKLSNWIIIAPLGCGTSCGASKQLVDLALDNYKSVKVLASLPFEWEGNRRKHHAVETISYIENLCEVITVEFDSKKYPAQISMTDIFNLLDEKYMEAIEKICV